MNVVFLFRNFILDVLLHLAIMSPSSLVYDSVSGFPEVLVTLQVLKSAVQVFCKSLNLGP